MLEALMIVWLALAFVCFGVGAYKGHPVWGFVLGIFLPGLGVIIMALVPKTQAKLQAEARAA